MEVYTILYFTVEYDINLPFLAPPEIRENNFVQIFGIGECANLRETVA